MTDRQKGQIKKGIKKLYKHFLKRKMTNKSWFMTWGQMRVTFANNKNKDGTKQYSDEIIKLIIQAMIDEGMLKSESSFFHNVVYEINEDWWVKWYN